MNTNVAQIKRYTRSRKSTDGTSPLSRGGGCGSFTSAISTLLGPYDPMVPDAEVLRIMVEVFEALELDDIYIKIKPQTDSGWHLRRCGRSGRKSSRLVSSAVDKLDKAPWDAVRKEMVEDNGLSEEVADRIGKICESQRRLARYAGLASGRMRRWLGIRWCRRG